jgi:hypothetical protein
MRRPKREDAELSEQTHDDLEVAICTGAMRRYLLVISCSPANLRSGLVTCKSADCVFPETSMQQDSGRGRGRMGWGGGR